MNVIRFGDVLPNGDGGTPTLFVQAAIPWYDVRNTNIVRFVVDGCRKNLPLADADQMGFGLIPVLESRIPGVDPFNIEGKALASSWPGIDDIARTLGVTPIGDLGDDDDSDDETPASDMPWFDAADGLRTVTALLDALDSDAALLPNSEFVRYDLEDVRNVLSAAVEQQVRFRFSMLG